MRGLPLHNYRVRRFGPIDLILNHRLPTMVTGPNSPER